MPAIITTMAATPGGFGPLDGKTVSKNLHRFCRRLVDQGLLYRAAPHYRLVRYFLTREGADAFLATNVYLSKEQRKALNAAKAKQPKPPRLTSAPKPTFQIPRSQPVAFKPRQAAVIVWPEGVKHTIIPTPTPRNFMVSHSFVHGGMGAMR